ncbi:hypothetical protein F5X68DRAFT_189749 [Plectosphaerella plurivora]|uniref:Cell wall protein PhiA n=1 Tax=Plectosphaerella plurivora TaxID=936078 RepID=A0A9P9ADU0_9PEZI|nr:hypothetical protein F5X68DRAFT_189749 [Plectosphaerella plurivora]
MQIPAIALSLLAAAASVAADGKACPAPEPDVKFGVMALRSASPIHFATLSAAQTKLALHLPEQNAQCEGEEELGAVFYIKNGELYLYGPSNAPQQIYVDRSGMGQGNVGYFDKNTASGPRNGELTGWAIVDENLTFAGDGLLACPSNADGTGPWYVWAPVGINEPAGNKGCLGFSARAIPLTDPSRCTYTTST